MQLGLVFILNPFLLFGVYAYEFWYSFNYNSYIKDQVHLNFTESDYWFNKFTKKTHTRTKK